MPTQGNWTKLKKKATKFIDQVLDNLADLAREEIKTLIDKAADRLFEEFHHSYGQHDSKGTGASVGSVARRTSHKLVRLAKNVSKVGSHKALQLSKVTHFNGKREVSMDLLDFLVGPARTLDDHAVRQALEDLINELFLSAQPSTDVEQLLRKAVEQYGAPGLLAKFWGFYLYHSFCRDFYEEWRARAGERRKNTKAKADAYKVTQEALDLVRQRINAAVKKALQDYAQKHAARLDGRSASDRPGLSELIFSNISKS
jgi:hypothetical protein